MKNFGSQCAFFFSAIALLLAMHSELALARLKHSKSDSLAVQPVPDSLKASDKDEGEIEKIRRRVTSLEAQSQNDDTERILAEITKALQYTSGQSSKNEQAINDLSQRITTMSIFEKANQENIINIYEDQIESVRKELKKQSSLH